jgi:hypothetical protein
MKQRFLSYIIFRIWEIKVVYEHFISQMPKYDDFFKKDSPFLLSQDDIC